MPQNEETKSIAQVLWDQFWLVIGVATVIIALGLTYTFVSKPVWEASATIVFPSKSATVLGATGLMDQGSLAASLTGGPTPLKIYKGYLESERTLKLVAEETHLRRKEIVQARKIVDQSMENSVTVYVRNVDADLAKKVVQSHLDALTKINTEVNDPLYADDAKVLGRKLSEQRVKVAALERQLLSFQENAVTAPSVTASGSGKEATVMPNPSRWQDLQRQLEVSVQKLNANIRSVKQQIVASGRSGDIPSNLPPVRKWRERLVDLEYELKLKEMTFSPESPEVVQLQEAVAETKKSLHTEMKAYSGAINSGALDPTSGQESLIGLVAERFGAEAQLDAVKRLAKLAPSESITLSRLTRELGVQSGLLQQVQGQYELAKLQEDRNPNRWHVLDEPDVAEDPVNKSIGKSLVMSGLLGFIIGAIFALIRDARSSRNPERNKDSKDKPLREAA